MCYNKQVIKINFKKMQKSEDFDISIGKEPGKKVDPEQDLLDAIHAREDEIEELRRIGVPEAEIQPIKGEVDLYREELEDLLVA
jgi:hypothetical protein